MRAVGASIHDRPRGGRLAEEGALDLFMLRYNAAHPGAERDVFPHLAKHAPAVVAYTATSWRQLLGKPPADVPPWPGRDVGAPVPPLTAALCYRFQLQSPHVHVALTGPADRAQLDANLRALSGGPLTPEEEGWIRAYGQRVARARAYGPGSLRGPPPPTAERTGLADLSGRSPLGDRHADAEGPPVRKVPAR